MNEKRRKEIERERPLFFIKGNIAIGLYREAGALFVSCAGPGADGILLDLRELYADGTADECRALMEIANGIVFELCGSNAESLERIAARVAEIKKQ